MLNRILALIALTALCVAQAPQPDRTFAEIDSMTASLESITGLKRLKPVQYGRMSRDEIRKFLEGKIDEMITPEELRAEELTLKKFGFLPADFDLRSGTVELMTEQAAAFYDYHTKKLYIVEGQQSMMQDVALVHELAHALADQHFNLKRFMEPGSSDDVALARLSVVEGHAMYLMMEHTARKMGQTLANAPALAEMIAGSAEAMAAQAPVLAKSPLYLRETLLFPYTGGMAFVQAGVTRDGQQAFSSVFRNPPTGTHHVLHPELYFKGVKAAQPPPPKLPAGSNYKMIADGDIGELHHRILIEQRLGKPLSRDLSPKWRGGQYKLYEKKDRSRTILAYTSEWADTSSAEEYFKAYRKILEGKWGNFSVAADEPQRIAGTGPDGRFELRLAGTRVEVLEGLE